MEKFDEFSKKTVENDSKKDEKISEDDIIDEIVTSESNASIDKNTETNDDDVKEISVSDKNSKEEKIESDDKNTVSKNDDKNTVH